MDGQVSPVVTDYGAHIFKFNYCGQWYRWQGDPPNAQPIQLHNLRRFSATDAFSSYFHLKLVVDSPPLKDDTSPDMITLLDSFPAVF